VYEDESPKPMNAAVAKPNHQDSQYPQKAPPPPPFPARGGWASPQPLSDQTALSPFFVHAWQSELMFLMRLPCWFSY